MDSSSTRRELFSVADKRVLITGGSRGIGFMLARAFAAAGAEVHLVGRSAPKLAGAAAALRAEGARCQTSAVDLGREDGVDRLLAELAEDRASRPISVLINNAGTTWLDGSGRHPHGAATEVFAVNLTAPLRLILNLRDQLRKVGRAGDPARVINIGSINGLAVAPGPNYAYAASKSGVHMMTRHLARDLAPEVTVNAIAPGLFQTDGTARLLGDPGQRRACIDAVPLGRLGQPSDIAGAAIFLASPAAAWVTGVILPVDGGESGA